MTLGHAHRLRLLTVDQAQLKPGEKVLDVGCGTGGVTIPAKLRVGKNGEVTGIDPAPEMIAVARRKASRAGLEIDFRVDVIESLPFPDGTFDAVTASLMMHHLPDHVQVKGLAEIRRVLKPGGRLLIADMMRPSPSFLKRFFTSLVLHHGHGIQFGIEDLPKLLQEAGFVEIKQLEDRFLTIGFVRAMTKSTVQAEEDTHMTDLPPYSTPRWVKIVGIIALVLVLLVGIILLTGVGGEHGPGRHIPSGDAVETPSGDPGGHTPPIEHERQQP